MFILGIQGHKIDRKFSLLASKYILIEKGLHKNMRVPQDSEHAESKQHVVLYRCKIITLYLQRPNFMIFALNLIWKRKNTNFQVLDLSA